MQYLLTIILGTIGGLLARFYMLRRDYRQYPSYPQGWAIHLFIGFIGAFLGSIIVPSVLEQEFAAVSFLLLAASQFREVRNIERSSLEKIEATELVVRGSAYIEGIARVFEARNYLSIITSLFISIVSELLKFNLTLRLIGSTATGLLTAGLLNYLMRGPSISDIADIKLAEINFDGPILDIGGVKVSNVGLDSVREIYQKYGVAAEIHPKDPDAKATLSNIGQMQAIAHDVSSMVGVRMDVGEQEYTPLVRRDPVSGKLVIVIVPSEDDEQAFLEAISNVPVLEGAIRKPLRSVAGRMMD
ncbi:MAG: hypothetical protein GX208_04610 [Firmicutes bacterium]|nr:hypothetical protein [Bacillota bacterium]